MSRKMIANGKSSVIPETAGKANSGPSSAQEFSPLEKYNWLIHLQHVRGEIQACKTIIQAEIKRSNGKNIFALQKKGEIEREEGKLQDALETFQACLKLIPKSANTLKEVAKCLYEMRRFKLCMEAYLEAEIASQTPDWQIYYHLGMCFLKLGDINKAKEYAHRAVQVGKQECCYAILIKILLSLGDLKSAIAVANAAVESCPDSANMLTESGLLHLKEGHSQQAFEKLSSALALEPAFPKAILGIGYITQKHCEFDVALTKYKTAIHYQPDSVALWNNIGMCFYAKQKYAAAISCLKRALWMQPLNWRTLSNLGLAHLATSQPASAFNFACAAVNLRPDVADCFAVLGASLMELKDPENAARAFGQALLLSPEDLHLILNASVCCLSAGSASQASEFLRKFHLLIENEATCTDELLDLAKKVSIELERIHQLLHNEKESYPPLGLSNQIPQEPKEKHVDGQEQVDMLRTSREIIERQFEPDEV